MSAAPTRAGFFLSDKLALGQSSAATTRVCSLDVSAAFFIPPLTTPKSPLPRWLSRHACQFVSSWVHPLLLPSFLVSHHFLLLSVPACRLLA